MLLNLLERRKVSRGTGKIMCIIPYSAVQLLSYEVYKKVFNKDGELSVVGRLFVRGALKEEHRDKIIKEFKNGIIKVLITTDLLARGFDQSRVSISSTSTRKFRIDGVKVDVQNILETLGAGHGGRLKLTRKYHQALLASIARNFPDNGIISCMRHNTNGLYSAKKCAVIRASDDFFRRNLASHTIHIASVAYNTVFLG